jgi:hypothetical protein
MKVMPGWDAGKIINNSGCMIINKDTNMVEGMVYTKDVEVVDSLMLTTMV